MKFGSKTGADGNPIKADSSKRAVLIGEAVAGNKLVYIGLDADKEGNTLSNRACIKFEQANGAIFKYNLFEREEDWAVEKVNSDILHIATKIVPEAEYYAAVNTANNFSDFITKAGELIMSKVGDRRFTLKIVYSKNNFPTFPKYPNFIELDGTTPSTLSSNPQYDRYTIIEKTDVTSESEAAEVEF